MTPAPGIALPPRPLAPATMPRAVDFGRDVYCIGGLPIDAIDVDRAVAKVRHAAHANQRCVIATPNLNFLVTSHDDAEFRASVIASDLSLADGMPLIWIARLLKVPIPGRVSGSELFDRLLAHEGRPVTVFFFGGPPGAAAAACRMLEQRAGGLRCVGYEEVPYASVEALSQDDMIERINRSRAEFVIVALGARKGQAWIEHNRGRLAAPVMCHLGAVVNFAAGTVARAPRALQVAGLEWLWRIKEEPTLWRRYVGDGLVLVDMLRRRVLPHAWRLRARRTTVREPPALEIQHEGGCTRLQLRGAWTHEALSPLRDAFSVAARDGATLSIALDGVTHGDSAFVALLMLALASREDNRGLAAAAAPVRQVLRDWDAEFLLEAAPG